MNDFGPFGREDGSWLDWDLVVMETSVVGLGFGFSVVVSEGILLGELIL